MSRNKNKAKKELGGKSPYKHDYGLTARGKPTRETRNKQRLARRGGLRKGGADRKDRTNMSGGNDAKKK